MNSCGFCRSYWRRSCCGCCRRYWNRGRSCCRCCCRCRVRARGCCCKNGCGVMHDAVEDLKGGGDTFDFRKSVGFKVSSISCLKSALIGVLFKASKKESTCNNYKAGVSGIGLGKGVWLRLWARKVLFEVVCLRGLGIKGTL